MGAEDRWPPLRALAELPRPTTPPEALPWILELLELGVRGLNAIGPARQLVEIDVSSGDQEFPIVTRAIRVGGAGDVVVWPVDGGDWVTIPSVQAGERLDVAATAVRSSGTTATDMVALF